MKYKYYKHDCGNIWQVDCLRQRERRIYVTNKLYIDNIEWKPIKYTSCNDYYTEVTEEEAFLEML